MSKSPETPRQAIRRLNILGLGIVLVMVVGFGAWAATAQLSGAVIGAGTIIVETYAKKVQHPTGGVVGEILVRDGDRVEAGQLLSQ